MVKISIIIPVYNCEKYIEQCLCSVLEQTLNDIEIICVDDGSTDSSAKIIQKMALKNNAITLFQQENKGPGSARNLALKKAKGKYVAFLDADDFYFDKNALKIMFELCENKNVLACASLRKCIKNEKMESVQLFQNVPKNTILNYRDFQIDYNYQDFIFLKQYLIENDIYFPDYRRFQDPPFLVRALFNAKHFTVANVYLYVYREPDIERRFNPKNICCLLQGLNDNLLFAKEHKLDILFKTTVYRLESEYLNIILENIMPYNLYTIELLIKANQIINQYYNTTDYLMQSLRKILFYIYERNLNSRIMKQNRIVLYGAGYFGQRFLEYLKKNNLSNKIEAFVVSDLTNNKMQIEGIPVIKFQDLKEERYMIVTVKEDNQKEIEDCLKKDGYKQYELINELFLLNLELEN